MKKTIKIGERFRYKNITLEVREGKGCIDCYAFHFKSVKHLLFRFVLLKKEKIKMM